MEMALSGKGVCPIYGNFLERNGKQLNLDTVLLDTTLLCKRSEMNQQDQARRRHEYIRAPAGQTQQASSLFWNLQTNSAFNFLCLKKCLKESHSWARQSTKRLLITPVLWCRCMAMKPQHPVFSMPQAERVMDDCVNLKHYNVLFETIGVFKWSAIPCGSMQ